MATKFVEYGQKIIKVVCVLVKMLVQENVRSPAVHMQHLLILNFKRKFTFTRSP